MKIGASYALRRLGRAARHSVGDCVVDRGKVPLSALDAARACGRAPRPSIPSLPMRGRYLSLQLTVDGCQSTLPSAKLATFPRDVNGAVKPGPYVLRPQAVTSAPI